MTSRLKRLFYIMYNNFFHSEFTLNKINYQLRGFSQCWLREGRRRTEIECPEYCSHPSIEPALSSSSNCERKRDDVWSEAICCGAVRRSHDSGVKRKACEPQSTRIRTCCKKKQSETLTSARHNGWVLSIWVDSYQMTLSWIYWKCAL